jgi:hypothetical protein
MTNEGKVVELLEELVRWTKVTSMPHVKTLLMEVLSTPEERIAFQESDGKSSKEVAEHVGVSSRTITNWWKLWIKAGIAEAVPVRGGQRAVRVFSLDDFGIKIEGG